MSGVFGIISTQPEPNINTLLQEIQARLVRSASQVCDVWLDPSGCAGLGRLGIGILNREQQPVASQDGQTILFFSGELFEQEKGPDASLRRQDYCSDAEYALHLYQRHSDQFVSYLAGQFTLAVYDRAQMRFLLANDRFGVYPLYYTSRPGSISFAPEVKAVLCASGVSKQIDMTSLAQYMRFQQMLGERTFFEDIKLLRGGSLLSFDLHSGKISLRPYWTFEQVAAAPRDLSFQDAVQEAARLMRRSVRSRMIGPYQTGLYLSGGLDSRTILAACPPDKAAPPTLTFGIHSSRDVHYALDLASRAGAQNTYCEFKDGRWVIDYVPLHLELTEGFHTWIHLHGISTLETARQHFEVNLTGFAGDQTFGGGGVDPFLGGLSDQTSYLVNLFQAFNQRYTWPGITEAEENLLYTPEIYPQIARRAFDSFAAELQPYYQFDSLRRTDFFGFIQSDMRLYHLFNVFARAQLDVRYPFLDYDLLDFVWSLPPAYRLKHRLQISVINKLNPALARVPNDNTDLYPLNRGLAERVLNSWQRARRQINLRWSSLFPGLASLHSNYEDWLRTDLKDWAASILFDPRTLERGIFSPSFIQSIWNRHQSGQEPWTLGKIAPIMTVEMVMRRFID